MAYDAKHDDVIELLLERGANVEGLFDYRGRLLHRASADGRTEVVRMVLRRKADVNVKGDMQWTPLHFALSHGYLEVVKLLVERKANVSAQVRDHVTTALPCTSRRDGDTSRLCGCCFKMKQTCTSGEMTVGRCSRPQ